MDSPADKLRLMWGAMHAIRHDRQDSGTAPAGPRASWHHTQHRLAARLGCTQPAISQAEACGASHSAVTLERFADALGCDWQLAIVGREVTLKHGVSATFRRRS